LKATNASQYYPFHIAAVIVKGNRVLSIGVNKNKTHPKQINPHTNKIGNSTHAELDAILGVSKENLQGATIYVARQTADGKPANAKPCKCCMKVIEAAGISRVFFT